jgi:hypothetical protein
VRSAGRAQSARGILAATRLAAPPWYPAAPGGLPPVRYPGHRPSPAGRRYARRARQCEERHPSGAPVLSRPRSPSRALATLASFGWRFAPLWTVIFVGSDRRLSVGWRGVRGWENARRKVQRLRSDCGATAERKVNAPRSLTWLTIMEFQRLHRVDLWVLGLGSTDLRTKAAVRRRSRASSLAAWDRCELLRRSPMRQTWP